MSIKSTEASSTWRYFHRDGNIIRSNDNTIQVRNYRSGLWVDSQNPRVIHSVVEEKFRITAEKAEELFKLYSSQQKLF